MRPHELRLFSFLDNPFYQQGLPLTVTEQEASDALDATHHHALISTDVLQTCLSDQPPGARLIAELGYLCDSQPDEIAAAHAKLSESSSAEDLVNFALLLQPLSSANFLVHVATLYAIDDRALCAIVEAQASVNIETIFNALKDLRSKAQVSPPSLVSVHQSLEKLFNIHADTIIAYYANAENAAAPLAYCVQYILGKGDARQLRAVSRIIEAYRRASESRRSDQEARIIMVCDTRTTNQPWHSFDDLFSLLEAWTKITRPLILYDLAHSSRRDDAAKIIRAVSKLIRQSSENDEYDRAFKLAKFAAAKFDPFFTAHTVPFSDDVRLISQAISDLKLNRLGALINNNKTNPTAFFVDLNSHGFGLHSIGLAKQAWDTFLEACGGESAMPWTMMSELAISFAGRDEQANSAAGTLLLGLIRHAEEVSASTEVLKTLTSHFGRFRSIYDWNQTETRAGSSPPASRPSMKGRRGRAFVTASLVIVALGLSALGYLVNQRFLQKRSPKSTPNLETSIDFPEEVPSIGKGQHLDLNSVRYCHYQEERLKLIKPNVHGPAALEAFNALAVDYNARCSDFFYKDADLTIVEAEVAARRSQLEADAQRIIAAWNNSSLAIKPAVSEGNLRP